MTNAANKFPGVRAALETEFAGGRHQRRVDRIADVEPEVGMWPERSALR
jgi:ribose 5-phosphate isomerase RpiB